MSDRRVTAQQRRTDETKSALLRAASEVLRENGYARASVAQIVRAAGRAHGTFYLYFANKEDIYASLLDQIWDDLRAQSRAVWRKEDPIASVHETVRRYVLSYRQNVELWQLLNDMSSTNPKFRTIRHERRRGLVRRVNRGIQSSKHLADLGSMRSEIVAELLAAMVDEVCAVTFRSDPHAEVDELVDHITTVWARAVGYVPAGVEAVTAVSR